MRAVAAVLRAIAVRTRADAVLRPFLRGRGAILMFHRVRPHDEGWCIGLNHQNSIPPALFESILDTIAAAGIDVVDLDEAQARLQQPKPRNFVCLTFDDGYRDNHDTVLPAIAARKLPITVYVTPGLIDGTAPLWWYGLDKAIGRERELQLGSMALPCRTHAEKQSAYAAASSRILNDPAAAAAIAAILAQTYGIDFAALAAEHMMSWAMVRRMAQSPFVSIGGHALTHAALSRLDDAAAEQEIAGSRTRLQAETAETVQHFAYPFGTTQAVGPNQAAQAGRAGFRTAVTARPGNLSSAHLKRPYAWPRHGIGPNDGPAVLRLKLSGVMHRS